MHNKGLAHSGCPQTCRVAGPRIRPNESFEAESGNHGEDQVSKRKQQKTRKPSERQEEVRQFWKVLPAGGHRAGVLVDSKLVPSKRAIFLARWQRPRCREHAPPSDRPSAGKRCDSLLHVVSVAQTMGPAAAVGILPLPLLS